MEPAALITANHRRDQRRTCPVPRIPRRRLDDFEQNLTACGQDFLDPAIGEVITALADAAETGSLLLPAARPRQVLRGVGPGLVAAELMRLFLRMPALHGLDGEDKRLLTRTIGGHPRFHLLPGVSATSAFYAQGHAGRCG